MKKLIGLLLVACICLTFGACSKKNPGSSVAIDILPEDATVAQTVIFNFLDNVNNSEYKELSALAEKLINDESIPFMGATMEVEEGYLNGFTSEITGFKEGYMFGPAIGSIPFIGYVFDTKDSKSAEALSALLAESADLRWNVCTQADDMQISIAGNRVCFVMAPEAFEEE